jgi:hypothetical protein
VLAQLLGPIRRWPFLERLLARVAGHFTTWPADDFSRFTRSVIGQPVEGLGETVQPPRRTPVRPPAPASIEPGTFELKFARLQQEGSFEEMWSMLAEDAQRSWGGEDRFLEVMRKQAGAVELVDASVDSVDIVPEWTDRHHNRTYRNVARVAVRYRIKHKWRELTVNRQVHLIPAADGWRTLWYPV